MKRNGEERKWKMEKQRSKENEPIHTETDDNKRIKKM